MYNTVLCCSEVDESYTTHLVQKTWVDLRKTPRFICSFDKNFDLSYFKQAKLMSRQNKH